MSIDGLQYRHAGKLVEDLRNELVNPPMGIRLPWWPNLTEKTGGLRMGELTILCAPTGSGKTQLLANIAAQLWEQHVPTFVAPVETGDLDFVIRLISTIKRADYNTGKAHSPLLVEELIAEFKPKLEERPLYIATYDSRVSVEDMEAMLTWQIQEHGVKIALLDNLNFFLKVSRGTDQNIEIDEAVRAIGNVAKHHKIHILLICHPRKTDDKTGRVLSEYDIKGSSTIVQEAANVLIWNRPDPEAKRSVTDREAVFRKMRRRGTVYGKKFWFVYRGGRFEEEGTETNPPAGLPRVGAPQNAYVRESY